MQKPGVQSPALRRCGLPNRPGLKVGLLGGSYNPAHAGHLHISLLALQRLGLDQVWWLVSPQNPLKSATGMAPLKQRLEAAQVIAADTKIHVTAIECGLKSSFTADTLIDLKSLFPLVNFVWLMGADNLGQLPRWRRWKEMMNTVPIAILGRPTYSLRALNGLAARHFRKQRVRTASLRRFVRHEPPAWCFITGPLHSGSATAIRNNNKRSDLL